MDPSNEWALLLAEEMEHDVMLDELTEDEVFARVVEDALADEDIYWEDVPY